ncbi:carbohydrate esterase [Perilla frutescens var. frutescens]|nr:carbohydrate esterase [Perilla frutescens var. frutescens]
MKITFMILLLASHVAAEKSIFLLAGQSNMVGRGGTYTLSQKWDRVTPLECQSDPRILRLNNESLREEAHEPLHENISFSACYNNSRPFGIGPGMPFSNSLLKSDPAIGNIGLVPCAVGGTTISQWSKGSCLYDRLLTRARASLRDGGALRGMLWYQGESDSIAENAGMYSNRLHKFFIDVRADLMSPSLPIIQVALASRGNISLYNDIEPS